MNTKCDLKRKIGSIGMMMLLLLAFNCGTFAQRFEGGLLGGFNASQVDGDHVTGYHKPGLLVGGYVRTDISRAFFIATELKYSQKGSRKNPDPKEADQLKYILRLGYIDVPFYLGFRTSETTSLYAGISGGYLMSAIEYDNMGEIPEIEKRPFNDFDFQALLGFRFDFTERISIDLRGAYSFLPMRDLPGDPVSYWRGDQFNNVLSTAIYYRLDF